MSGFSFKLKPKKAESKNKLGFSLGGQKKDVPKKKNAFANESDSEDEENKKTVIESFDPKAEAKANKTESLVIKPSFLSRRIPTKPELPRERAADVIEASGDLDSQARLAVMNGVTISSGPVIETPNPRVGDAEDMTTESYDEVPVEEFGMALLRGMGWNGKSAVTKPQTNTAKRKQGLLLGIGAKALKDEDLAQELLSSKAKFSVPLVKKSLEEK